MHLFLVPGTEPIFKLVSRNNHAEFARANPDAIELASSVRSLQIAQAIARRFMVLYQWVLARGSTLSCRDAAMTAVDLFLRGAPLPRGRLAA